METLQNRTTEPGLRRMAASSLNKAAGHCDKHGEFESIVFGGRAPFCPTCAEENIAARRAQEAAAAEAEYRARRAEYLLGRAAIPPRFADRRLSNYVAHSGGPAGALQIAKDFAREFDDALKSGRSLIFCGGVGAGKTHLAVGICHEVIAQNRVAVFTTVLGAIRSVKETYSKGAERTEQQAIDALIEPHLLVLDEVGIQFGSETEKMILFEIINGRYENLRPTILISNLAKQPLTEYLGERVVDRMREGGGRMVIFDWPSYRRAVTA
ncbi:ATP-binding protein [Bordetella genomosp. 7]|nr:ATP-binding protein [Bordetella genomosp. 7]